MSASDPRAAKVIDAEHRRIAAQTSGDWAALRAILGDDLHYVHANALVDTKESMMTALETRLKYNAIDRDELTARIYGDVAVMTGKGHINVTSRSAAEPVEIQLHVEATQVWVDRPDGWQMVSWHSNILPKA